MLAAAILAEPDCKGQIVPILRDDQSCSRNGGRVSDKRVAFTRLLLLSRIRGDALTIRRNNTVDFLHQLFDGHLTSGYFCPK
jgi:hypothetical protein